MRGYLLLGVLLGCSYDPPEVDTERRAAIVAIDLDALPAEAVDAAPMEAPIDAAPLVALDAAPPVSCTTGRPAIDWRPGDLAGRPWTEENLPASSDNPDISWWTKTVYGPVDQVRLSPPNYGGSPAYQHQVDYAGWIDQCPGYSTIRAWFYPGIYTVEVSYLDGRPAELFTLFAGSTITEAGATGPVPPGEELLGADGNGEKDPHCPKYPQWSEIPKDRFPYDAGAFVIEEGGPDNGFIERAVKIMGDKAVRAGDVATGAQRLFDAYTAKGSAIDAVIYGHGNATSQAIGAGTGFDDAKNLFMTGTKVNDAFKAKLTDKGVHRIKKLALMGCCVGSRAHELKDEHLMCDMARGLAPGAAITEVLGHMAKVNNVLPSDRREGYFVVSGAVWTALSIKKGHCDAWTQK